MRDRFSKKEQREHDKDSYRQLVSVVADLKGAAALFKEIKVLVELDNWTFQLTDSETNKFLKALSIVVKLSKGI